MENETLYLKTTRELMKKRPFWHQTISRLGAISAERSLRQVHWTKKRNSSLP